MFKPALMAIATIVALTLSTRSEAFQCNECHSKNPKMVAMHKALQGKNCFECHKMSDKLMGKGAPKDIDSLMKRRESEAVCLACHKTH